MSLEPPSNQISSNQYDHADPVKRWSDAIHLFSSLARWSVRSSLGSMLASLYGLWSEWYLAALALFVTSVVSVGLWLKFTIDEAEAKLNLDVVKLKTQNSQKGIYPFSGPRNSSDDSSP